VVVSGRKQVDHWITEREKNLVGHFLIKCTIKRKELVLRDKPSARALRRPGILGRERDVEALSKNE